MKARESVCVCVWGTDGVCTWEGRECDDVMIHSRAREHVG